MLQSIFNFIAFQSYENIDFFIKEIVCLFFPEHFQVITSGNFEIKVVDNSVSANAIS
jgi:hypothetical protein